MRIKASDTPVLLMLSGVTVAFLCVPLRQEGLLIPGILLAMASAPIVLFTKRDPARGRAITIAFKVLAAAVMACIGAVVWFIYEFIAHPPSD